MSRPEVVAGDRQLHRAVLGRAWRSPPPRGRTRPGGRRGSPAPPRPARPARSRSCPCSPARRRRSVRSSAAAPAPAAPAAAAAGRRRRPPSARRSAARRRRCGRAVAAASARPRPRRASARRSPAAAFGGRGGRSPPPPLAAVVPGGRVGRSGPAGRGARPSAEAGWAAPAPAPAPRPGCGRTGPCGAPRPPRTRRPARRRRAGPARRPSLLRPSCRSSRPTPSATSAASSSWTGSGRPVWCGRSGAACVRGVPSDPLAPAERRARLGVGAGASSVGLRRSPRLRDRRGQQAGAALLLLQLPGLGGGPLGLGAERVLAVVEGSGDVGLHADPVEVRRHEVHDQRRRRHEGDHHEHGREEPHEHLLLRRHLGVGVAALDLLLLVVGGQRHDHDHDHVGEAVDEARRWSALLALSARSTPKAIISSTGVEAW